ncbi:optineurin-like [Chlamydotis macqueenii]
MSSKLKSHPAENGEHPKRKTENGTDSMAASTLSTYTPEEMVQQMKELIAESNELKEAMKLHNQAMKDRYEELSICREKQKEEREFHELQFQEVQQRLLDKCMENKKLQQQLQNLKEREGAEMEGCMAPEKEMRQLISQVQWLQAEKANMLGIISELQVKLNISAEDSFVETGMNEGEINRTAKEHQENSGEMTSSVDIYGRSKTAGESKNLQSEELIVSQLLYCLRNETRKREELEKELQNHKERLSKLEKKTSNCLKSGTQTEQQAEESSEAVGSEVETLSLQVCALFKELQEAHEKVKEAELIQKQLQEKCQVLERKSSAAASELEEKQQLIYTIKKLELQVESVQAEVKLEQAKAHEEKARYRSLQDTNSKLLPELTKAMKTIDEMKLKELHRADKVVVEQLNAKVELAEQAPAAKQLQIDEMKQIIANYLLLTTELLLEGEVTVQNSGCRKCLDLSPEAGTGSSPACKRCAHVEDLLPQGAELQEVVRRLCSIREACTEGKEANDVEEWKLAMARTSRRKRLPPKPEVPLQNRFTSLQTKEERPSTSGEMLELSKAAQPAPHITTSTTKRRPWVIVVDNSLLRGWSCGLEGKLDYYPGFPLQYQHPLEEGTAYMNPEIRF